MTSDKDGYSILRIDRDTLRYQIASKNLKLRVSNARGLVIHVSQATEWQEPKGDQVTGAERVLIKKHVQEGLDFLWTKCSFA